MGVSWQRLGEICLSGQISAVTAVTVPVVPHPSPSGDPHRQAQAKCVSAVGNVAGLGGHHHTPLCPSPQLRVGRGAQGERKGRVSRTRSKQIVPASETVKRGTGHRPRKAWVVACEDWASSVLNLMGSGRKCHKHLPVWPKPLCCKKGLNYIVAVQGRTDDSRPAIWPEQNVGVHEQQLVRVQPFRSEVP